MRIAIVTTNQQLVGGAETYLRWLLPSLLERGHHVAFAFERAADTSERAVDRGLELLVRWHIRELSSLAFLDRLTEFRPDVVFLQSCEDSSLDQVLAERFSVVLFAHGFYGTCATGWRVHRIPELAVCTRRFGGACLPINYLRGCGARSPFMLLKLYSAQRARARVLSGLAGLIVASDFMRGVFVQHGVPENNIRVIPYPAERAPDPAPPNASESRSRVLFLGRLASGKGGARAIQATARCQRTLGRPLHLTLAGEGSELARCKRLALRLGVQVDFPGWVGPDQRLELLRGADALIVPSLWPEPFGIVGIEAASVGLPAAGYRVGGIVDWLRSGETGELADGSGFSPRALATALQRVLVDAEHHRQLQQGAWRMAHEFSGARHLSLLEQFLEEVTAREPAASLHPDAARSDGQLTNQAGHGSPPEP